MYPELVRWLVRGGATVLANLSNDAWSAPARGPMHLDMARLRAVEERRWLVRATTTGISAIVDPSGRIVAESAVDAPAVVEGVVRTSRTITPYQAWGDLVAWLAAVVATATTVGAYVRRPQRLHGGES
jgi:apolipoprotein N-acyltransferase